VTGEPVVGPDQDERAEALGRLVSGWLRLHGHPAADVAEPAPVEAARLAPDVLDVVARVGDRTAHVVMGLRRPGDELRPLRPGQEAVLGLYEDHDGLKVAVDALRDAELAGRVLAAVSGPDRPLPFGDLVTPGTDDEREVSVAFGQRWRLTSLPWIDRPRHPGIEMMAALAEVGFGAMARPVVRWRRHGRDLGLVQEQVPESTGGWPAALTSLREHYASGGQSEGGPGDFAPAARQLGQLTGRLHLALDRSFGRRPGDVATWVAGVEAVVAEREPELLGRAEVARALATLGVARLHAPVLRTHGDLHLGCLAVTEEGWVLVDTMAGGRPPGAGAPEFRSPLADVADLMWSLHHVAAVGAAERDPDDRQGLAARAREWEERARRAFLSGYLATPGIGGLVPADRPALAQLVALFELERGVRREPAAR
jgi:predicted trehalose synthase